MTPRRPIPSLIASGCLWLALCLAPASVAWADRDDTGDTGDTELPEDTGSSGGPTGPTDTGHTWSGSRSGSTAGDLAGEQGGSACNAASAAAPLGLLPVSLLLVAWARREVPDPVATRRVGRNGVAARGRGLRERPSGSDDGAGRA